MALTESTMLALGTTAPDFSLPDTRSVDRSYTFQEISGDNGTLVVFICNHCPYVIHVIEELVNVANDYTSKGIGTVHISSNDVEKYPVDSPDHMQGFAEQHAYTFPYLYDESQAVAKAYAAACTPDIYLFDANDKLYYRGRLDANRPGTGKQPDGSELRAAIDAMLSGQAAPVKQYPSAGCNIKWK